MGDQILVKNLKLGSNLKIMAEDEEIIATVQEPMSEAELEKALEAPTTTVEDVEVIKKEKEEEVPEDGTEATPEHSEGSGRRMTEVSKESSEKKEDK